MATFNLTVTYPDAEQARILAALKAQVATAANPSPSNAEAIEWLRQRVVARVKATVRDYERSAAAAAVVDVGAT